jgi:hypothetical protein
MENGVREDAVCRFYRRTVVPSYRRTVVAYERSAWRAEVSFDPQPQRLLELAGGAASGGFRARALVPTQPRGDVCGGARGAGVGRGQRGHHVDVEAALIEQRTAESRAAGEVLAEWMIENAARRDEALVAIATIGTVGDGGLDAEIGVAQLKGQPYAIERSRDGDRLLLVGGGLADHSAIGIDREHALGRGLTRVGGGAAAGDEQQGRGHSELDRSMSHVCTFLFAPSRPAHRLRPCVPHRK